MGKVSRETLVVVLIMFHVKQTCKMFSFRIKTSKLKAT